MSANKNLIRHQNIQVVLKELFQKGTSFASDLVKETGISMVTINSLLKDLVSEGMVTKGELVQREIGRPAIEYCFNYKYSKSLLLALIEVNRQLELRSYHIDLKGTILAAQHQAFSEITPTAFQNLVRQSIEAFADVEQIAVLLPGKISEGVVTSSWYEKFDGWDLDQLFKEITPIPCFYQNDAHLLTVGHCIAKQISLSENIVGIYNPENSMPGITLIFNASLLEGQNALAGEAKYLPGFIDKGAPKSTQELVTRLSALVPFYNAAFAPDRFVFASTAAIEEDLLAAITHDPFITKQPNHPVYTFVHDFDQAMILGMHWLLFRNTPYDLSY